MGSEPNRLIRSLQTKPDSVLWTNPRYVQILRGDTGKLGLRFQTIQCFSQGSSNTVVLRVRNTCNIKEGELRNYDRINKINGIALRNKSEDEVDLLFQDKQQTVFNLEVQTQVLINDDKLSDCPTLNSHQTFNSDYSAPQTSYDKMNQGHKPKRMLSNTSSGGRSSLNSVERPSASAPNKRFVKSNSTETDETGMNGDQMTPGMVQAPVSPGVMSPPAPSVNGYLHGLHSLPDDPVPVEGINIEIEDNERTHSMPQSVNRPIHHGCDNGVGAAMTRAPEHLNIPRCNNWRCTGIKEGCDWHALIFRVPQFVVWDIGLEKIDLKKGNSSTFGIKKKVKIQEATGDMYTLVESVESGSVAEMKGIRVGDWIRSINGKPLQSRNEAHHTNFDQYSEIDLVSQRPVAILDKARPHLAKISSQRVSIQPLKTPMNIPGVYSPSSPFVHSPYMSHSSPIHQPWGQGQAISPVWPVHGPEEIVMIGQPRPRQDKIIYPTHKVEQSHISRLASPSSPQTDYNLLSRGVCRVSSPEAGQCSCKKEINLPRPNEFVAQLSPEDNCSPGFGSLSPRSPRDGPIPSTKLFLCGNSAIELGEMILSRSQTGQRVAKDLSVQHFEFSLKRVVNSDIFVDFWQKKRNEQHNHVMNGNGYFNTSTSCNQCVLDSETVVNVELFVIQDENFFHHCSPFMFVEDSIFLVAFNAQRILVNMSSENRKLERIIHTIHSYMGSTAAIELYGVLSGAPGEDHMGDEVRTMFYTNDKQHGKYSVSVPKIHFVTRLNHREAISDLYTTVMNQTYCRGQRRSSLLGKIAEGLSSLKIDVRSVWTNEEVRQLVAAAAQTQDLVLHIDLINVLEQMGCLKGITDKSRPFQEVNAPQEYFVHPLKVHNRLVALCFESRDVDSDVMFRLSSSGMLPRSSLLTFLCGVVPDVQLFTECLKTLGVVYDMGPTHKGNQGREQMYLFPYYLEDLPCDKDLPGPDDVCLYAVFNGAVPWTLFYKVASALAQREECVKVTFTKKRLCILKLKYVELKLMFDQMNDQIIINIYRGGNSGRENQLLQLLQEVFALNVDLSLLYDLGVPCPLLDSPTHRGHVINLSCNSPIKCGMVSLNSHKNVKKWITVNKQMSMEEYLSQNILKLPIGVFQDIVNKLVVAQDNDWRALADYCGMNTEDVTILEGRGHSTNNLPSKLMLIEWGQKEQGTIRQLYDYLVQLQRPDITKIIAEHLRTCETISDFREIS